MTNLGQERGTQPERTALSWTRTSLAVLANGVILLLRDTHAHALHYVAAAIAGALTVSTYLIGVRRQRLLAKRPLPERISPRQEVYLTGASVIALILISALSLAI